MNKKRMSGVFDPITVAFILAIVGTIASLSLDGGNPSSQDQSQSAVVTTESVAMIGSE